MRIYALLLGVVFTAGYGYAAQVAVASVGVGRHSDTEPAAGGAGRLLDRVWYGGQIDPITVESKAGSAKATVTRRIPLLDRSVRCVPVSQPGYRAVS
ncbi:MAG TPA: hypothetical protein VEM13_08600 [Gemmatimonadales bacterium]|nr:hypothetical protein [Gemmatimonadales bacterium]